MTATQQAPVYSGTNIAHSIFGAINYDANTTIASAATAARLIDSGKAETAISVDSSPIDQVISFYRSNFTDLELTAVATASETDTIDAAIEHNISLEIDGEIFNTGEAKPAEKALKRLQHATIMNVEELSKKTVLAQLRDVIPTPAAIKEAIDRTVAANHLVDPVLITGYANWYINKVRDRVLAGRRITTHTTAKTKTKHTMRTGNTRTRVKYKHEPVKNMRVLPMRSVTVDFMLKGGVFVNKADKGTEKTEFGERLLAEANKRGLTGMYTAHRRTIVKSRLQGVTGVTHYQEIAPGTESDIRILKICANSIIKENLSEWMEKVDVLVIDESMQTLRHICLGTVDQRQDVFYALLRLIKRARTVLMLDADNNDKMIEYIRMARPDDVINVLEKNRDLSGVTLEMADRYQVYGSIFSALKKERFDRSIGFVPNDFRPVMICSDRKDTIQKLDAKIGRVFRNKYNTLSLHSKNIMDDAQQEFMKNPNDCNDVEALMFSPALVASLSVTSGYFGRHVALLEGVIPATESFQMIGRDRLAKHHLIGLKNSPQYHPDTVDQLLHGVVLPSPLDRFSAEIEAEDNFIRNNFKAAMYFLAVDEGYNVVVADYDAHKAKFGRFWEASATAIENSEYRQKLLNAVAADDDTAETVSDNQGETDSDTEAQMERRRIEQALLKSEITQEDVRAWKRGKLIGHIANVEILIAKEQYCEKVDLRESNFADRDRRYMVKHNDAYQTIFGMLGIDPTTGEGEFTQDQATAMIKHLMEDRLGFNKLRLKKTLPKTIKVGTSPTKAILKEFGLDTQVREVTGRQRAYSITPESWSRMMNYVETRKQDRIEKANAQAKKRKLF